MITDEDAEKCAEYLRDSAVDAANAKANAWYVAEFRKTMKSQAMKAAADTSAQLMPLQAQERDAYCDPEYIKYLDVIREAKKIEAEFEFWREAAKAKISAWQTMHKTIRGVV